VVPVRPRDDERRRTRESDFDLVYRKEDASVDNFMGTTLACTLLPRQAWIALPKIASGYRPGYSVHGETACDTVKEEGFKGV